MKLTKDEINYIDEEEKKRFIQCNYCMWRGKEDDVPDFVNGKDEEHCPLCGKKGCLTDNVKADKFYSLFCLQNNHYMASGPNSLSKEELKECFLSYISIDFDDWEGKGGAYEHYSKISIEELTDMWEMEIHETDEPIKLHY